MKKIAALSLGVLGIVGTAAASFAIADSSSSSLEPVIYQVQPVGAQTATAATVVALSSGLGAFAVPATSADQPPVNIVDHDVLLRGANPSLARLAVTTNGQSVYLVPADGGVCLVSSSFLAAGCFTTDAADTGIHFEKIICSPYLSSSEVELFGLAADDVTNVAITMSDGSQQTPDVSSSVFVVDSPKSGPYPISISWNDPSGNSTQPLFTSTDVRTDCGGPGPRVAIAMERAAIGAAAADGWGSTAGSLAQQAAVAVLHQDGIATNTPSH
jgi:hypothetical protein